MMRGVASTMEKHHKVQVLDEALESSVKLSHRYIPAASCPTSREPARHRERPVAISQHRCPPRSTTAKRSRHLDTELDHRAQAAWASTPGRARRRPGEREPSGRAHELDARWSKERTWLADLRAAGRLRGTVARSRHRQRSRAEGRRGGEDISVEAGRAGGPARRGMPSGAEAVAAGRAQGAAGGARSQQGERPLILPSVDAQAVASVSRTGPASPWPDGAQRGRTLLHLADLLSSGSRPAPRLR